MSSDHLSCGDVVASSTSSLNKRRGKIEIKSPYRNIVVAARALSDTLHGIDGIGAVAAGTVANKVVVVVAADRSGNCRHSDRGRRNRLCLLALIHRWSFC